jgi:hypothetical protein
VSDRDVVMHNITEQDPVTKTVTSKSNSVKGLVSEKEDCVRLYSATSLWVLKPLNKNTIDVSYEITVDPSGNIPSWLANLTMDTGPTHTISKLKEQIKKPEYANKKYNHIIDY